MEMNKQTPETPDSVEITSEPKKAKKVRIGDGRRFRYGSTAVILTVVVVIVAILLNVAISALDTRYPMNLDFTKNKVLTLSDESKTFAKALDKDIKITICGDEKTYSAPDTGYEELDSILSQLYAAINQYKTLSGGHVTYEFIDLNADIAAAAKYSKMGAESGSIIFESGDRNIVDVMDSFYSYDDNYQTYLYYKANGQTFTGSYSFNSLVERQMVIDINKVTNASLKPVTLLTGHGEDENVITALTDLLENNGYEVLKLDITTQETFDDSTNFAVIPAPSTDYSADELKKVRTWVQNDGKLDHQMLYIVDCTTHLSNLSEYFADNYGIEVTSDWIVETSSSRLFNYYVQYTYGDVADTEYTSASDKWVKSPVTMRLKNLWTDDTKEAKHVVPIVTFPDTAQLLDVNEYMKYVEEAEKEGADPDYQVEQRKADSYPLIGMSYSKTQQTVGDKTASSCALVCGSSMYFSGYLTDAATSNEDTFLNVFNGLAGNENTVSIPGKSVTAETLDFGSEMAKKVVGLGIFTIGIPLILLIIGITVFVRRRNL